jgi:hypothetical protein
MTAFSMSRPMPHFFVHPWALSENSIERAVERATDIADALYTTGKVSQSTYNEYITAFHEWSENAYRIIGEK